MENSLSKMSTASFYTFLSFLVPGEFFHEYMTCLASLMNLIIKGWDQICSVCLIQFLILQEAE